MKRNLFLERRLITTKMAEFPKFEEKFRQYKFIQMTRVPDKYIPALVQEFYAAYKEELQRKYPQGQLWRGRDPIILLFIHGVRIDVPSCTIAKFLYELDYQPLVNIGEIDFRLGKIRKITQKQMGLEGKLGYFWWMTGRSSSNSENAVWVVGGSMVTSQKIKKNTFNFESKVWWMLARHRICLITGYNVLSLVQVAMIVGSMPLRV